MKCEVKNVGIYVSSSKQLTIAFCQVLKLSLPKGCISKEIKSVGCGRQRGGLYLDFCE